VRLKFMRARSRAVKSPEGQGAPIYFLLSAPLPGTKVKLRRAPCQAVKIFTRTHHIENFYFRFADSG